MRLPTATYRLQLREGMDFARAAALVPYLDGLGISHLYLSPVFTAAPGSTHGYDVTDIDEIEPALGGRAGLEALSAALADKDMGLILDIVPNHMAFTVHNVWLADVLRNGQGSRYARHFDIDWAADCLPLPWLPAPFAEMAEAGDIRIDGTDMVAGDLRVPLAGPPVGDLSAIHDAQPWRLTHWRTEAAAIAHRRFFTVTGLIGLRVEDRAVFEDVHRLTFDLVDAGIVHGLRVDHVDGLADPATYLARLRDRLPDTPIWVEKILTGDEALPDWPVQGTTGYEAARAIARVLTDAEGAERLAEGWPDFVALRDAAKTQVVETELPAELERLTDLAEAAGAGTEWGRAAWRAAMLAYIRAFPRYRTYLTPGATPQAEADLIHKTAAAAAHPTAPAVEDLAGLLLDPGNAELRIRLQQLTGAAIAKAQEDTAFYRWTPLLSANEVGGEPDEPAMDAGAFHAAMVRRQTEQPHGLTLISSHDTKRSADARMRIAAISHDPAARDTLMNMVRPIPDPWRWYLAQSAWAAAPDGRLTDRLPDHLEKAMREAKVETFWIDPDDAVERPVRDAATRAAAAFEMAGDGGVLAPLAVRAAGLALAQCALQIFAPGIPDIYQGTEIGSHRLTDPDNRVPPDWDGMARLAAGETVLAPFDRLKFDLTRTLLHLRREIADRPWAPQDAPAGRLAGRRGDIVLEVSRVGLPFEGGGPALWPPDGPAPVCVTRMRSGT
ncbi:MAG: malto-oligosyltrehalose synthase [Pseudomonadota bacterium]